MDCQQRSAGWRDNLVVMDTVVHDIALRQGRDACTCIPALNDCVPDRICILDGGLMESVRSVQFYQTLYTVLALCKVCNRLVVVLVDIEEYHADDADDRCNNRYPCE